MLGKKHYNKDVISGSEEIYNYNPGSSRYRSGYNGPLTNIRFMGCGTSISYNSTTGESNLVLA